MIVEREEFLSRCGLGQATPGTSRREMGAEGFESWVTWSRDGAVSLQVYATPATDDSEPLVEIFGSFDADESTFDLQCRDNRQEAARQNDLESAMAAFRRLTHPNEVSP